MGIKDTFLIYPLFQINKISSNEAVLFKDMPYKRLSTKECGSIGEKTACEYLMRHGFTIIGRNVARKTGEIDIIAQTLDTLHFVEVKSIQCERFPSEQDRETYNPAFNLHPAKIRKVARTGEWYIKDIKWEGPWQIDAVLVWLCVPKRLARIEYLPQIQ